MKTVLLALCALCACKAAPREGEAKAPPGEAVITPQQLQTLHIETAPVEVREVGGALTTSGRIAFDDLRVAHVFSPVTGRVTSIRAQLGQRVQKGAPLAGLQSPDLGSALADVRKAEADLVAADHELARQKDLFAAHAGPQRDLEIAEDNQLKARAELNRAREKAKLLHWGGLDSVTQEYLLRSPIAGEVIARNVNPGTEVQGQYSGASSALELFTVGSLDEVWVFADVFEIDLAQVKLGAQVGVSVVSYPGRKFEGRIDWISGALDPATRTARVRCTLANPLLDPAHGGDRALKPEMYATVEIAVPKERALAIPREAVLRLGDQLVVFAVLGRDESGMTRFARRVIKVDEAVTGDFVPVTQGLNAGDNIVVHGGLILSGMI
jgi:cobalt-zinc-cadmium efflux system membrane fusion protein